MSSRANPTLKSSRIRVGITLGDPSGIGPSILVKALNSLSGKARFTVIGSNVPFEKLKLRLAADHFINIDNVKSRSFLFGKILPEYGKASIEYLDKAMELIKRDLIDCLVTLPVSKEAVNSSGFKFSGHTEYLAKMCGIEDTVMMLLNKDLKFSLVTRHIPLKDVPNKINKVNLENNIAMTARSLKELFKLNNPRIIVCGLNPHASDNGVIGDEENRIIKPVLKKLKPKILIDGPISADIAVALAKNKKYDCVIVMYHTIVLYFVKLNLPPFSFLTSISSSYSL